MKKAIGAAIFLVLAIMITTTVSMIALATEKRCAIDPVPYEKLLADTLERIIAQDWSGARNLIAIAEETQICWPQIAEQHEELYRSLEQLTSLMQSAVNVEERFSQGEIEGLKDEVSQLYNNLDYVRKLVYDYAVTYYDLLSGHARDRTSFVQYKSLIEQRLEMLKGIINTLMERLASIYLILSQESVGAWIDVSPYIPRNIFAGDTVSIGVITELKHADTASTNVSYVRVKVSLIIGNLVEVSNETITKIGDNATIYISVPDAAVLSTEGVKLTKVMGKVYSAIAEVVASVESLNGAVRGFAIRSTYVYAMLPPVRFYVPPYGEANSTLTITAESNTLLPINVSIYIDEVNNGTFLMNATIYPGTTLIDIQLTNISAGYHTIIFVSEATGRYMSSQWSSAVVIGSPNVPVIINVPRIVLVPPFLISVSGELGQKVGNCDVVIYLNGIETYRSSLSDRQFSAILDLPMDISTIFIGQIVVKIEVIPHSFGYSRSVYVVNVLVINVLSSLVLVGITGALYLHPRTSVVFSSLLRAVLIRSGDLNRSRRIALGEGSSFRPFKLRKYYTALIKILSVLGGYPEHHETLREYLRRIGIFLGPRIANIVKRLFILFELDLYSKHSPSAEEAERLMELVKGEFGEEVRKS